MDKKSKKKVDMSKPCPTCERIGNGLYLAKFRENTPRPKKLVQVPVNLGKEYAHRYIYFYAALPDKKKYNSENKAYGNYSNKGIQKLDQDGRALLILEPPAQYKYKGQLYPPHIHFLVSTKTGRSWIKKEFTIPVLPQK